MEAPDSLPSPPAARRYETLDAAMFTRLALGFVVVGLVYFVRWKLNDYERKPIPEVVSWNARPLLSGSSRSVEVTAKVQNAGGTGAVTLVATLQVGEKAIQQRETVVIAGKYSEDFRFLFEAINAAEVGASLSLAGDPWGHLDPARKRFGCKIEF